MGRADQAVVLVSGGMDSVAALHWAVQSYRECVAVLFDYGQRNRDAELTGAHREARALGVAVHRYCLADTLPRGRGILAGVPVHDGTKFGGVSPAFVPGRNLVFLTIAAAHASAIFPNGNLDLVIGACRDDAVAFPDCEAGALAKTQEALRHCVARHLTIVAPWIDRTKAQIIAAAGPLARDAIARSWSCYDGAGPCGVCTACVLRARAFEATGLTDRCERPVLDGGDPARACR